MDATDVALISGAIFLWGALSSRLQRMDLTAAITFVAVGVLLAYLPGPLDDLAPSSELIKLMAEVTLVLVLFSDAARVGIRDLRADLALYGRLLAVGLPLTIVLGTGAAYALFPDGGWWGALLVGAALAPTDAALGAAVMTNPAVPARIRRLINVESGLNDGIATPVVLFAIAGLSASETGGHGPGAALAELGLGVVAGLGIGGLGGALMRYTRGRGWSAEGFAGPAVVGLALCAYATALAVGGNGFVAAFVAGAGFGNAAGRRAGRLIPFVEETGGLASLLVWLLFGAVAVIPAIDNLSWQAAVYAILSVTVIRMLPVGLALMGAGLSRATVAFTGWFGPRGLASVIFALLVLEELGGVAARPAVTVITITVLLSVLVHGITSGPLARRYGAHVHTAGTAPEHDDRPELSPRVLTRREHRAL